MLYVNEKQFNPQNQLWKDNFWPKIIILKVRHDVRQLILRFKKRLWFENLTNYCLYKEIFLCFSLPWNILYKHKVKQITELARTLRLLDVRKMFLFNVNVNTSLSLLWKLGELSKNNQALKHLESTWALGGHLDTLMTRWRHSRN